MADRRTAPLPYRQAQRAAREIERRLLREVGANIDRALRQAADRLTNLLVRLPDGAPEVRRAALERSLDIIQRQRQELATKVLRATQEGREASFRDVLATWQDATAAAAKAVGIPNATLGAVLVPRVTQLAAFEATGGARLFRTLVARAADDGFQRVNDLIRGAIAEGKSFDSLAKALRPFVRGAVEGGAGDAADLAAAFRTVRFNATRIAYSEIHNARAEAEVQHFVADPLVRAVAWRLSPDRGTLRGPDACDTLAETDFYGLGAGVYPVTSVPLPPHPFDRSLAAWTPVLTETGWRRVDQVRAGDRVLTHRGRWCVVSESLAGRVTGGWMRLRTTDGRVLELTNDHPVLLASGRWTLAGCLCAGDFLVATRDQPDHFGEPCVGVGSASAREAIAVEDVKCPVGRVQRRGLRVVLAALLRRLMPAAMNLESEFQARDGDIDVEAPKGIKSLGRDALVTETIEDRAFVDAEALVPIHRLGALAASGFGLRATGEETATLRGAVSAFGKGHALPDQDVGFVPAAPGDAPFAQAGANRSAVDAAAARNLGFADALVDVPARDLIPVELVNVHHLLVYARRYCLTVANDKSFVAGGIVVHNCERVPIVRRVDQMNLPKPTPPLRSVGIPREVASLLR